MIGEQPLVPGENVAILTADNFSACLGEQLTANLASLFWFLYLQSCKYSPDLNTPFVGYGRLQTSKRKKKKKI